MCFEYHHIKELSLHMLMRSSHYVKMLLCTVNDLLSYGKLLGYKNKGKKACPICIDDLESTWIPKCKHVFMHHRKFLPRDH